MFQPHLPVRLPCYDLAPVTGSTLNGSLRLPPSGLPDFHGLTGGVYKVRERIHRAMADARLLAIPASRGRVADPDPKLRRTFRGWLNVAVSLPAVCAIVARVSPWA